MSASLDGIVGRDAIESIADVQSAITSGGSITTTTVTASTLNTNQMTIANDQINAIGSSTDIIVNTSATGAFKMDNLQVKTNTLSSTNTDGNIVLSPNGTGNIVLGTMTINADQVIGASEDDYVMTYDHSSGTIGLEAGGSASPWTTVGSDITYNTGDVKVSNLTLSSEEITQSAGSDLRLTTTAKVKVDNLSLDAGTLQAEIGDLTLTCDDTTNKVFIGSLPFKLDQSVGAGQDGYVLSYDNSTGKILLEPPTGTSNWTTSGSDIYRASQVGVGVNSSTINSQLMVKDTGSAHTALQITSGASQNCSVKLSRGAGDWSSSNNETIGLHMDTDRLLFSKLTAEGNNLTGYAGSTMDVDCQNSRVGIACYPYGGSIANTLQLGSIASGRTESIKISTNAGAGVADKSIEMGVDATSSFIESNDSANAPIELQVRQGTNGNVMVIDTDGDIGLNQSSPGAKLHINASTGKRQLQLEGDPVSASQVLITGGTYGIAMTMNNSLSSAYALSVNNSGGSIMYLQNNGYLGIGTSSPRAPLEIISSNAGVVLSSGQRQYFDYNSGPNKDTNTWTFNAVSIYARGDILSNGYILSHASTTFSDRRIKDNIVDVEDDQCLQTLRLIKPKQYTYRDIAKQGTQPVWGFIAQEVAETLPYAVSTIEKEIPNVYKRATVSPDRKTLIFAEPIVFEDEHRRVILKTHHNKDVEVLVVSHSPTSLTLEKEIEQDDISIENQVFVYGQIVKDFHHLKKDAIFTVAVSALQEVDRQQQLHKNKISTLEARMALLEQRLNNANL